MKHTILDRCPMMQSTNITRHEFKNARLANVVVKLNFIKMSPLQGLIFACCQMLGHISQLPYLKKQNFEVVKIKTCLMAANDID